jgi:hypothetical protein
VNTFWNFFGFYSSSLLLVENPRNMEKAAHMRFGTTYGLLSRKEAFLRKVFIFIWLNY